MSINKDKNLRMFCTDYTAVENYDLAIADDQRWDMHHRLETHDENGNERDKTLSIKELKERNLYFHRPPSEFIFLTKRDHMVLHSTMRHRENPLTEEHIQKLSDSRKGYRWFTNGKQNTKALECPDGYRPGRMKRPKDTVQKMSNHFAKCKWWTNGEIDKFTIECPDGFYPGRTNFHPRRKEES